MLLALVTLMVPELMHKAKMMTRTVRIDPLALLLCIILAGLNVYPGVQSDRAHAPTVSHAFVLTAQPAVPS